MGMLGATLFVVIMVVVAEAQVLFPSNTFNKEKDCIASNGQAGFCYEFRSSKFKECSFFPSQDTSNPNIARHLTANVCKNTGKEVYFCCPSPPKKSCATIRCQANAQCFEGSGNKPSKCNCNLGYRSYQDMCIATCNVRACQANALCVEGSGAAASVCLCKKGYRSHNGKCLSTCNVRTCQANALCVEGSGAAASVCLCKKGYRSHNGKCLSTCQTTKCPENARCLEGSGSTSTSCKCKNGYKSTRTACIELRSMNTVTQKFNPNIHSTQDFGGSSVPNQGNSWNQFRDPTQYQYQWYYQNGQNIPII